MFLDARELNLENRFAALVLLRVSLPFELELTNILLKSIVVKLAPSGSNFIYYKLIVNLKIHQSYITN